MREQFMGVGTFAKSPNVTAQTRKNLYLEFQKEGESIKVAAYPTPGLVEFVDFGDTPCRGLYVLRDFMYAIHKNTFWEINNAGVTTNRGTLDTSSGRCSIIDNGTEIHIVDGQFGYVYNVDTTTFTKITDGDFSTTPRTTTFNGGFFIYTEDLSGKIKISGSYDGLTYDALDFATAESNPDYLVRVEEDRGDIVLFGLGTTEFWALDGNLDFPYSRIAGTDMQWGLKARWSVTKFKESLMFLGKNREGQAQVVALNGYNPTPVSDPDIDKIINSADSSNATAFSYMVDGHNMYQLNLPTQGRSLLYDGLSKVWSETTYEGSGRHRGEIGVDYISRNFVSDYLNGKIYRLDPDVYTDNTATIVRELTGRHYEKGLEYFTVQRFMLDAETGVGLDTGQGDDPQVMMQYSIDGGHTWSEELWTSLGKIGEYDRRAEWWRLGRGRNFTIRVRLSDPVKPVFTGAGLMVQ